MSAGPPSLRVLLVEDEAPIRELVATLCEERGATVAALEDGGSALRAARELRPALILLDVVLPVLDGISICRFLRADPELCRVPVYMLSASARDRAAAAKAGATGFLDKPFRAAELFALLDRHRARS